MKVFTVSADSLNAWFASVSPDCLHDPRWGRGDLRRCEGHFFANHAWRAWGLKQVGYPIHLDGYKFIIVDEELCRSWGLDSWGEISDE
jgi:hypothetical protein